MTSGGSKLSLLSGIERMDCARGAEKKDTYDQELIAIT